MTTIDQTIAELEALFGARVSRAEAVRKHHGDDLSYIPAMLPDAVFFAESTRDISQALAICNANRTPVIPFGTGTSIEGQTHALKGGVTIDVSGMARILAINEEDFDAVVQPGVRRKQLNEHLRATGLSFPVDPGADASIGGMAATRASGTNAVRYGTMRENVLALEVVLPDGKVIRTGTRARKSSTGYDLTKLFVGSEGTLGIITEATVRLHPIPAAISSAVCTFTSLKGAVDAVIATMQSGVPMARIEFLDEVAIEAANNYSKLSLKVAPTLFLEFHGTEAGIKEQAETVEAIAAEHGAEGFEWASRPEDRNRLWQARHDSSHATRALRPGSANFVTDACVPISALAENILAARTDADTSFLRTKINGHVGDGNFHVNYLVMPGAHDEIREAERLAARVVERALASGGTASGEHGVGLGKLKFLRSEHGPALESMVAIKQAFDPNGIMNPGKIGSLDTLSVQSAEA
ncbi:FAD-linked oxidase C-terminal domain-containing protein [Mesorhizobium sp. DCY119]|uniref:FAD-binding oxidoreductase n=1 Tax=Mesorhizobium sp. DCY119 TaxID=2108445 RepID=UPI000E76AEAC|nr:FAD-linked oxidase C-terminal domain-containing protein [Mesorhizobium sp. DCY119]RJG40515.1 FAD-binding protein [Mesorhizobium sp. DCY119]